jgi:hypothetical protein
MQRLDEDVHAIGRELMAEFPEAGITGVVREDRDLIRQLRHRQLRKRFEHRSVRSMSGDIHDQQIGVVAGNEIHRVLRRDRAGDIVAEFAQQTPRRRVVRMGVWCRQYYGSQCCVQLACHTIVLVTDCDLSDKSTRRFVIGSLAMLFERDNSLNGPNQILGGGSHNLNMR